MKIGRNVIKAADIIKQGGVVIYPTETVYGMGANIFSEEGVRRVFAIKKRNSRKPVSIAVASFEMMKNLAYISNKEEVFIKKLLPGPVTVLLRKRENLPYILTPSELIGIRFPDHEMTIHLIELAGVPITSTSANISGETPPKRVNEIKIKADYILDGGVCRGKPSTVVDLINLRILRKGEKYEEVQALLQEFNVI